MALPEYELPDPDKDVATEDDKFEIEIEVVDDTP